MYNRSFKIKEVVSMKKQPLFSLQTFNLNNAILQKLP